jgi:hypothetical protein
MYTVAYLINPSQHIITHISSVFRLNKAIINGFRIRFDPRGVF